MNKAALRFIFYGSTILGLITMVFGMGWFVILFGIILIPMIILHFVAGIRALRRFPVAKKLLLFSSLCFLLFFLIKPDFDDVKAYSGFSSLLYHLGLRENQEFPQAELLYLPTVILLIGKIIIDIILIRKTRKMPTDELL